MSKKTSLQWFGSTWVDDNGDFHRDPDTPTYDVIWSIDIEQAAAMRDNWLRMIRDGKMNEGMCRITQRAADDLDFLIRGGKIAE